MGYKRADKIKHCRQTSLQWYTNSQILTRSDMNSLGEASCRLESVHNYINKDMERLTSHVRGLFQNMLQDMVCSLSQDI